MNLVAYFVLGISQPVTYFGDMVDNSADGLKRGILSFTAAHKTKPLVSAESTDVENGWRFNSLY